ncbi:3-hydroxyisobutyrate dehydrogenase-related beta-hydroxyacid dehydrogenase [Gordonia sp. KTR9]|nr:3-hydroxyisobutyrate dehydrogenase-related beta-hydroxyacid dehydrogenase [Gordonia sp. KTR9]
MDHEKYTGTAGYIGLGNMGGGIATRLARTGVKLVVFDIDPNAVDKLVAETASAASSVGELATASDTIIVCVDPEHIVKQVVQELVEHLRPGKSVVIQSSVSPTSLFEVARLVEGTGATLYDAPVSGSVEDRVNGTLSVLVGASPDTVGSDKPLLERIGRPLYLGTLGGGEVAKLCNNAIMTTTRTVASEMMKFAKAYGLTEEDVREAVAISSGASWVLDNWDYFDQRISAGLTLRMSPKQVEEILAAANEKGVRLRMLESVLEHGLDIDKERFRLLTGKDPDTVL